MDKQTFVDIIKPHTVTSIERMEYLYEALEHARINRIPGDFVECGVYKGGNILGFLKYLEFHNMFENTVWAYDTFEGMTPPEDVDKLWCGTDAKDILDQIMCYCSLDDVKSILKDTKFPSEKIKFVVGDVCETLLIPDNIPDRISVMRLDTDWYKSTKMELEVLWDKVSFGGVVIIDDYGDWQGSKKATDEFFLGSRYNLHRIDFGSVAVVKI